MQPFRIARYTNSRSTRNLSSKCILKAILVKNIFPNFFSYFSGIFLFVIFLSKIIFQIFRPPTIDTDRFVEHGFFFWRKFDKKFPPKIYRLVKILAENWVNVWVISQSQFVNVSTKFISRKSGQIRRSNIPISKDDGIRWGTVILRQKYKCKNPIFRQNENITLLTQNIISDLRVSVFPTHVYFNLLLLVIFVIMVWN